MKSIRSRGDRGGDPGAGGSEGSDPPAHHAILEMGIPAIAGIAVLAPVASDVRFPPALAWLLVVLNLAVVVGAILLFGGSRRRGRKRGRAEATGKRAPSRSPATPRRDSSPPAPPAAPPPRAAPRTDQVRADPAWSMAAGGPERSRPAPGELDPETLTKLGDPDPFVRVSAVAAMRGRVECEPILVRALHDRYPIVRREVVRTLRTTGSPIATETLIKVAAHDPSAEVREEAVASLGALLREGKPQTGTR